MPSVFGWWTKIDRAISADGIFHADAHARGVLGEFKNRPIVTDSGRNLAKFVSPDFSFEIKSEDI